MMQPIGVLSAGPPIDALMLDHADGIAAVRVELEARQPGALTKMHTDTWLLRFLVNSTPEKASDRLHAMLKWRRENRIDEVAKRILEFGGDFRKFPHFGVINRHIPQELLFDKAAGGGPVSLERWGQVQPKAMLEDVGAAEWKEFHFYKYEFMRLHLEAATAASGTLVKWTTVIDVAGAGVRQKNKRFLELVKHSAKISEQHYREMMGKVYIVNTSPVFAGLWTIVKVFLPARTLAKISISRTSAAAIAGLYGKGAPNRLPSWAGGDGPDHAPPAVLADCRHKLNDAAPRLHVEAAAAAHGRWREGSASASTGNISTHVRGGHEDDEWREGRRDDNKRGGVTKPALRPQSSNNRREGMEGSKGVGRGRSRKDESCLVSAEITPRRAKNDARRDSDGGGNRSSRQRMEADTEMRGRSSVREENFVDHEGDSRSDKHNFDLVGPEDSVSASGRRHRRNSRRQSRLREGGERAPASNNGRGAGPAEHHPRGANTRRLRRSPQVSEEADRGGGWTAANGLVNAMKDAQRGAAGSADRSVPAAGEEGVWEGGVVDLWQAVDGSKDRQQRLSSSGGDATPRVVSLAEGAVPGLHDDRMTTSTRTLSWWLARDDDEAFSPRAAAAAAANATTPTRRLVAVGAPQISSMYTTQPDKVLNEPKSNAKGASHVKGRVASSKSRSYAASPKRAADRADGGLGEVRRSGSASNGFVSSTEVYRTPARKEDKERRRRTHQQHSQQQPRARVNLGAATSSLGGESAETWTSWMMSTFTCASPRSGKGAGGGRLTSRTPIGDDS